MAERGVRTAAIGASPDAREPWAVETAVDPADRDGTRAADAALRFIRAQGDTRFFLLIHGRTVAPALGAIATALEDPAIAGRTLVVATGLAPRTARNTDRASHVPLVFAGPGVPAGAVVAARVRTTDIAPTVLDLLGIEPPSTMSGRSLTHLAAGGEEPNARVAITEGQGMRAVTVDPHRLVTPTFDLADLVEPRADTSGDALFDLATDPTEQHDLAHSARALTLEMRARLAAALENVPAADAVPIAATPRPRVRFRIASGGRARRVSGTIALTDPSGRAASPAVRVAPFGLDRDAFRAADGRVELAFHTAADALVGFDLELDPWDAAVSWDLYLDDAEWPPDAIFGGRFGALAPQLRHGFLRPLPLLEASDFGPIDPRGELGLFVIQGHPRIPSDE